MEWTLIEMPLPRLQVVAGDTDRWLYDIGWNLDIERQKRRVADYQAGQAGAFDNNVRLLPGVGDHLVALNGILRPLVHRAWTGMVAQLNELQESKLEAFLFGINRTSLAAIRPPLIEIQRGACFYCGAMLGRDGQVDGRATPRTP